MMLAHDAAPSSPPIALPRIAASSSFYTAMRVLPKERRNAVMAIYAFCRAVDDIADDWRAPRAPRLLALQTWGDHIDHIYARGQAPDLRWLSEPIRAYKLARNNAARLRVEDPLQGGGRTRKPQALFITLTALLRSLTRNAPTLQRRTLDDAGA